MYQIHQNSGRTKCHTRANGRYMRITHLRVHLEKMGAKHGNPSKPAINRTSSTSHRHQRTKKHGNLSTNTRESHMSFADQIEYQLYELKAKKQIRQIKQKFKTAVKKGHLYICTKQKLYPRTEE